MSAPVASETRSPLRASSEIRACSAGGPSPAATRSAPKPIAVQAGGMRLIIQSRAADVGGRGVLEEFFFDRVLMEPGDGAQPPGDGGAGAAFGLQVPGEGLDAGAPDREQ